MTEAERWGSLREQRRGGVEYTRSLGRGPGGGGRALTWEGSQIGAEPTAFPGAPEGAEPNPAEIPLRLAPPFRFRPALRLRRSPGRRGRGDPAPRPGVPGSGLFGVSPSAARSYLSDVALLRLWRASEAPFGARGSSAGALPRPFRPQALSPHGSPGPSGVPQPPATPTLFPACALGPGGITQEAREGLGLPPRFISVLHQHLKIVHVVTYVTD